MITQPLKWHGGKSYMAKRIIDLMPPHTRYCEPFAGGLAVLFQKPCEGVAEFVNDLNYELTNFWCHLKYDELFQKFQRLAECTPLSQWEFDCAEADSATTQELIKLLDDDNERQALRRAYKFFIRYRQSRQGLGKDFCTPTGRTRRGMNENVSAWLSAVDGLPEAHARLRRVEIRNQDACEFIRKLDSEETLFYCDPPYLHETRHKSATDAYECEMDEEQHHRLLLALANIKGKFILSGYPSKLYSDAEAAYGWHRIDIQIDNKSSGAKVKEKKTEVLWMNYEVHQ
jgi:DNA adenine methylase